MRYRNIKTGIEFNSICRLSGDDFEEVTRTTPAVKPEPKVKTEKSVEPVAPKKVEKGEKVKPLKRVKK